MRSKWRGSTPRISKSTWRRSNLGEVVREVVASMQKEIDGRPLEMSLRRRQPAIAVDRRLMKLAIRQLLDNALKYSLPGHR